MKQKFVPALWIDNDAMEVAEYYIDIFSDANVISTVTSYNTPNYSGYSETVRFQLCNQEFIAINDGPEFKKHSALSFFFTSSDEEELNRVWYKLMNHGYTLIEYGEHEFNPHYGWLEDKYGISWQFSLSENEEDSKIKPTLLFTNDRNGNAEEAAKFYTDIFSDSKVDYTHHYGENAYVHFTLSGFEIYSMDDNTKSELPFNETISLMVLCEDQAEIDYLWEKLSADKDSEACGWLKDKYGVSWQIVPRQLNEMYEKATKEQNANLTKALLEMKKLDLKTFEEVYSK